MTTASHRIAEVEFAGVHLRFQIVDETDHIQRVLIAGDLYESDLLADVFARVLPRGAIVDVGANVGNHAIFFAAALRRRVIAIEPYQPAFSVLAQNVALNGLASRMTLINAAAGRRQGAATIEAPPAGNWGRSRVHPVEDGEVQLISLDDLLGRRRVCVIKIDVEGMEDDVLQGARRLLRRDRPLLYVEAQNPSRQAVVARRLRRAGYELLRRFNYTPTYLFAHCSSRASRIDALIEKTRSLTQLSDLVIGQRQSQQSVLASAMRGQESVIQQLVQAMSDQSLAIREAASKSLDEAVQNLLREDLATQNIVLALQNDLQSLRQALGQEHSHVIERLIEITHGQTVIARAVSDAAMLRAGERTEPRGGDSLDPLESVLELPLPVPGGRVAIRLPRQAIDSHRPVCASRVKAKDRCDSQQTDRHLSSNDDPANDFISVVMTTYNSAGFVAEAVRNVLAQTYANLELIVVDDASHDGTFEILQGIAHEDPRVRAVQMLDNRGTYWCKNYGLTIAAGRYVTFQDSDDRSEPHRLARQLQELRATDALICTCNYVRTTPDGQVVSNRGLLERKAIMATLFELRAVLDGAGFFDSVRTSADDEFTRRLGIVFGQGRICHVDEPLYLATVREGSLTAGVHNRSELGKGDGSPSDQSFLSAPRREYVRQYSAWHARLKSGDASPFVAFPLLRRPFPAPALLQPGKAAHENFVTASMASMPSREPLLRQVVGSILPQVDVLNVYLNGYETTPEWLSVDKVQVVHSRDFGDLRDNGKFFFLDALLDGYHFTIDDDIVYPPDYVQKCVLKIEQYRRQAIIGVHGVILANPLVRFMQNRTVSHFKRASAHDAFVNLLGTGTTAYHKQTLELSFSDFHEPGMADVWLAIAAKRQHVPMVSVARPERWLTPLAEADDDSLFSAAQRDDFVQTQAIIGEGSWGLESLREHYPLCRTLATEFTRDQLRSLGVDVEALLDQSLSTPDCPAAPAEQGRNSDWQRGPSSVVSGCHA